MSPVVLLLIGIFIYTVLNAPKPQSIDEVRKAVCPPHQWYWHEIKDHEGEIHAYKIVCKVCGPLKERDDGRDSQES
jgi:hypothetical protein